MILMHEIWERLLLNPRDEVRQLRFHGYPGKSRLSSWADIRILTGSLVWCPAVTDMSTLWLVRLVSYFGSTWFMDCFFLCACSISIILHGSLFMKLDLTHYMNCSKVNNTIKLNPSSKHWISPTNQICNFEHTHDSQRPVIGADMPGQLSDNMLVC